MHVAIVHYHLRAGGVTRVIEHSVRALLAQPVNAVVLAGAIPAAAWSCPLAAVAGLHYPTEGPVTDRAARTLVNELKRAARRALGHAPDLWHIHNHTLGKNPVLTKAIHYLAAEGQRLLLHIHDFAEDGRPELYHAMLAGIAQGNMEKFGAIAYPQAAHVHYATLSERDSRVLRAAGAQPTATHWLPNPVVAPAAERSATAISWEGQRRLLYPTRAIRRKNIGEVILWALLGKTRDAFALTLAPASRTDRAIYATWKKYARRWRLPIQFEVGLTPGASLAAWLRAATAVITTSVAEGFGLAFLEPWLADRPVLGRNLPEITSEFRRGGIRLPFMYERLDIPVRWIGARPLRQALAGGLAKSYRVYGRSLPVDAVERAYEAAVQNGAVDFGKLNEPLQLAVIDTLRRFPRQRRHIRPGQLAAGSKIATVRNNAALIAKTCNSERYGERLMAVYRQLLRERPGPLTHLAADIILDNFLAPERFCLLRA